MKRNYKKKLIQIKELLDNNIDCNDGSPEFGLLWHIYGLVSNHVPSNNTAIRLNRESVTSERADIKAGMIRQSTNNPL